MKKYSRIFYIILIFLIVLSVFFAYKVMANNNLDNELKNKTLSEVKELENKLANLFNKLNNINFENYVISITETKDVNKSDSSEGDSESSEGSSSDEASKSSKNVEKPNTSETSKKYELKKTGILTNDIEINWEDIKNSVEDIYPSLYTLTLDIYQLTSNQEDIIKFNKEYDNLTISVKDENKEDTLKELAILYDYMPGFIENCTDDEKERIVIKTKNNIFKSYSILDKGDWVKISEYVNTASQEYTKLVADIKSKGISNQYNINKTYVMLNELKNAVTIQDKEVFLIKYKNLLEELKNV